MGGEWVREKFREYGIKCLPSEKTKSELYQGFLPLLNSRRAELLDNKRMINQICSLERRTARGGRESIDHSPNANAHDDVCNVAAGAMVTVTSGFIRAKGDLGIC